MSQATAQLDLEKLTEEEASLLNSDPQLLNAFKKKHSLIPQEKKQVSAAKRVWEGLRLPEQMVTQLLTPEKPLTSLEPEISPSLAKTLVTGAPRVLEETGRDIGQYLKKITPRLPGQEEIPPSPVLDILPGLVSRGAILTAGALKGVQAARPALSFLRKGALATLEKTSGIAPRQKGALEAAYKDPSLLFAKSKEAGSKFYEAAKKGAKDVAEEITKVVKPERAPKVIVSSIDKLNAGTLKPIEALKARKAVDAAIDSKTYLKDDLIPLRKSFDAIAKTDPNIAKGDELVARGVKASAIRQLLPTNIGGTFSSFRTGIGAAAASLIPGGKVLAPAFLSPLTQGVGATALGAASKLATPIINAPVAAGTAVGALAKVQKRLTEEKAKEFLKKAKNNKAKAREMALKEGFDIPVIEE